MGNNLNVSIVNEWMSRNYAIIAPKFYDKDALHDALCIIYNLTSENKIDANTLSIETIRLYYNRCVTNKMFAAFAYIPVEDSTLEWIIDQNTGEDEQPESKDWFSILEYAKSKITKKHACLIDLHVKGLSVKNISMYTGLSVSVVSKELKVCKSYIYNLIIKTY